jgi:serine/threonine-protein kinase
MNTMASRGLALGRYTLFDVIASGGMASVHFGRMMGPAGFARTVAIKRLHPHLAHDAEFATMFLDEARLAARVQHPNVVQTLDVVSHESELLLVMEYVRGETLSRLLTAARRKKVAVPHRIVSAILLGVLHGLDAAHEAKSETGQPLLIVHRDISPQNVLVGADGVVRVVDFGVAKAASRAHSTRDGQIKGKLQYMAPEQIKRDGVDRRADVYAVGVMLWECLAGKKLFVADDALAVMHAVLQEPVPPIGEVEGVSEELATIVHRALDRDPTKRFESAAAMAEALEAVVPPAPQRELAAWVREMAAEALDALEAKLADIESSQHASEVVAPPKASASIVALTEQPTSMVSGISVVNDTPAKRRTRWPAIAALGGAVAIVTGVVVWRVSAGSSQSVTTRPQPPEPQPSITATQPTPTETTTATATQTVSSPLPTVTTTVKTVPPRPKFVPPKSSAKPTANCTPPVYVDSAGIEHVKPECLK